MRGHARINWRCFAVVLIVVGISLQSARSQQRAPESKPVLYVVGTSHLDSQWNWTVQDTIREFVPNTFFENFRRFEQYPDYTFNYEGVIHYMWFKEYHPEAWPIVQKYVAAGRWRLAGSWINAVDVNVPSPESLMRQALYGKYIFAYTIELPARVREIRLPNDERIRIMAMTAVQQPFRFWPTVPLYAADLLM